MKKTIVVGFAFIMINQLKADYYNQMQPAFLLEIINKLENGENITFTKFGDGEYSCMVGVPGQNMDHDTYHSWLGESLKKSLISLSNKKNTYIGRWWTAHELITLFGIHSIGTADVVSNYCNQLARQNNVTIPWTWYHLFMNDDFFLKYDYMYKFVKFLVNTKRKKILICNHMNRRLKDLFRSDVYIEIPSYNWSFEYTKWKDIVESNAQRDCIILICAGLCSKVLIDDITNKFDLTFIDLGSSFDILGRKQNTRGWRHTYQDEIRYYKDLLPSNWD